MQVVSYVAFALVVLGAYLLGRHSGHESCRKREEAFKWHSKCLASFARNITSYSSRAQFNLGGLLEHLKRMHQEGLQARPFTAAENRECMKEIEIVYSLWPEIKSAWAILGKSLSELEESS